MWPKLGEIPFAEFWEMVLTWHTHSQTHWRTDRPENRIPPAPKIVGGGGTKTVVIHCTAKRQFLYGVLLAKPVVRLSETDKLLLRLVHTADKTVLSRLDLVSNLQLSCLWRRITARPGSTRDTLCSWDNGESTCFQSVTEIWSFNEPDNLTAKCDVIWKLGRDKTKLSRLVRVGGVNKPYKFHVRLT